ncbi:MAG: choice-of-anchor P family protein [Nocardioidaceae bacterium]
MLRSAVRRRLVAASTALAASVLGLAVISATPAQAGASPTGFNFQAYAYGTRVRGGSLPASSGKSAYALVSCTSETGRSDHNSVDQIDLGGSVTIGQVQDTAHSYRANGGYHSAAVSRIASVTAGSGATSLSITAIRSRAHSWHDDTGFHSTLTHDAAISYGGMAVPFPGEGQTVPLPGLGTLTGGTSTIKSGASRTLAAGYALKLHLDASASDMFIGRTYTVLSKGAKTGVMTGRAYGSDVEVAKGSIRSGQTGVEVLPCRGTGGDVRRTSTASADLGGQVVLGATVSKVRGVSADDGTGDAWTRSTVARVDLGGGQAVIRGVQADAHVHKTAGGTVTRDARGTTPGSITVNGETHTLPRHGSYEVPGLALIETRVTRKTRNGIRVTAVRVTLLSGSAAQSVVDLGNANVRITRS